MLEQKVLADDAGVLGLGVTGEREFGRRHFGDLVAAFTAPLLMNVRHGMTDLGTVHPTSLASRRDSGPVVLLLSGRSWRVVDVDWRRRAVSVVPADGGGRSRWLGAGRALLALIAQSEERIVAGMPPACELSKRAAARLDEIRERLSFVDGKSLPLVSDGNGRITVWLFAGGIASAALARSLADASIPVAGWDDVSVTVKVAELQRVRRAMSDIDVSDMRPSLPEDLSGALKFGICLPAEVAAAVIMTRLAIVEGTAGVVQRTVKLVLTQAE